MTTSPLATRLDNLTTANLSRGHFFTVLQPVTDEATRLGAFNSTGHLRGLFNASAHELRNMASLIGGVFGDLVNSEYDPSRDSEFEALKNHALSRFETGATALRAQLDDVLKRISPSILEIKLDDFDAKKSEASRELDAKLSTALEAPRNVERKSKRAQRTALKHSVITILLSGLLSVVLGVGVQKAYQSKQDQRMKTADQRFALRLEVQRALGPPLEAVSSYLHLMAASNPADIQRTQKLLGQSLIELDEQVPLQTPRIAFAYDSATVDTVLAVLGEFDRYYARVTASLARPDSLQAILGQASDISNRATALLFRLGSYERP